MAESKGATVTPLNSSNYATWKIQCKMALIREGLWGIVSGEENPPEGVGEQAKYAQRRDKALATIVLAIDPSLLYLLGADPKDPKEVWKALADQFQRNTWANKLELKRKLFSQKLAEDGSVQDHVKSLTEIFDALTVIDEPVKEEDRVVYLLASLPENYNVIVTALEASPKVPEFSIVTERLLHEEKKIKSRVSVPESGSEEALAARSKRFRCHFCHKVGHFKRDCVEFAKVRGQSRSQESTKKAKSGAAFKVTISPEVESDESVGLVVQHALTIGTGCQSRWILDSGATCHMCNRESYFEHIHGLDNLMKITLGDGSTLQAAGRGNVVVAVRFSDGKVKNCTLYNVLYVPGLSYNLLSVPAAARRNKITTFTGSTCEIRSDSGRLVACGHREGSLYYLDCDSSNEQVHSSSCNDKITGTMWHRRFGHLGLYGLKALLKHSMVDGLDVNDFPESEICESCIKAKAHRLPFEASSVNRAQEPLGRIHSDVCGKMGTKSLSGGEYFVTFIDDYTHYVWIYILKKKDEVLQFFCKWKEMVELESGRKVKIIRSDNGGEYTSFAFSSYLASKGIKHEFTVPHTPEQNGVAERQNRTLIEGVRAMLNDSGLPHRFWAEALSTAVYVRNRSPTKVLQSMTPCEAWHGIKPNVKTLRIFGCRAYAHVPKVERRKLEPKARKCVLLGYGEQKKGYRLFDISSAKVIHSRDVVFNESSMPGIKKEPGESEEKFITVSIPEEHGIADNTECTEREDLIPETVGAENDSCNRGEDNQEPIPDTFPPVRRSSRNIQPPDRYGFSLIGVDDEQAPMSVSEALSSCDKQKWKEAMEREMKSLYLNDVWELMEPPEGRKIIGSKWIFRKKVDTSGTVSRYKARLVAQGCSQKPGLDYEETFSPVVCFESIRSVISISVQKNLQLHQMDVTTAFLHGELAEEIYMKQPEGYIESGNEHLVCRLKKSIYGLKQAPRCWNHALDNCLKKMNLKQSLSDPCVYISSGLEFLVAVYVDDIILGGNNGLRIKEVKKELGKKFEMKDLGKLHHFLGVAVNQDQKTGSIWIGQASYIRKLLQKFEMSDCKPVKSPANPGVKLTSSGDGDYVCDEKIYRVLIGSLLFLSTRTRPDIAYAVGCAGNYVAM